jgi:ankyrin repeat protein
LHIATWNGHLTTCKYILNKWNVVHNPCTNDNYAAVHLAAWNGDVNLIQLLHSHGADLNMTTVHGWTPLHLAAWTGNSETAKFLIDNHANNHSTSFDNFWTALHLASWKGHLTILINLMHAGADINAVNINGVTPLQLAIQNRQLVTAAFLLEQASGTINDISMDITPMAKSDTYQFPIPPSIT